MSVIGRVFVQGTQRGVRLFALHPRSAQDSRDGDLLRWVCAQVGTTIHFILQLQVGYINICVRIYL